MDQMFQHQATAQEPVSKLTPKVSSSACSYCAEEGAAIVCPSRGISHAFCWTTRAVLLVILLEITQTHGDGKVPWTMGAVVAGIVPSELGSAVVNSWGDLKTEGLWWGQAGGHQRWVCRPRVPHCRQPRTRKTSNSCPHPSILAHLW